MASTVNTFKVYQTQYCQTSCATLSHTCSRMAQEGLIINQLINQLIIVIQREIMLDGLQ